jgi:anti-anti-sigma factor
MLSELWSEESRRDRRSLAIDLAGGDDERPRIVVTGDVDDTSTRELQKAVIEVLRRHCPRRMDLDLAGVTFLDSAGISALLLCRADAAQVDCEITLRSTPPMAYRVLQVAGLLEIFGLAKSRAHAVIPGAGAALGLLGCGLSRC